jgi:hypothetical protein
VLTKAGFLHVLPSPTPEGLESPLEVLNLARWVGGWQGGGEEYS